MPAKKKTPKKTDTQEKDSGKEIFLSGDVLKKLQEARKCVPRYLFRSYTTSSGGGYEGLNSEEGIIPHAFLKGSGHKAIKDIPLSSLRAMVNSHLSGAKQPLSEFSSWSPSLPVVFNMLQGGEGSHICVIDTHELSKEVSIYHVLSLREAGITQNPFDEEYLAHGEISGPAFSSVSISKLRDVGLRDGFYGLFDEVLSDKEDSGDLEDPDGSEDSEDSDDWEDLEIILELLDESQESVLRFGKGSGAITTTKVTNMRKIAEEFGKVFTLAMTVAFLTICPNNDFSETGTFSKATTEVVLRGLVGLEIPHEFGSKDSIVKDDIYTEGFPCIAQMAELLRCLVEYSWGKGARSRLRKAGLKMEKGKLSVMEKVDVEEKLSGREKGKKAV